MRQVFSIRTLNGTVRQDVVCLGILLLLMVSSWLLIHGSTRAVYDQYSRLGSPSRLQGPVGEAGHNQLGPWGYFWSERAFHYRTTLMFAVDDYTSPEVLSNDRAQQYPEGVDAWAEYTLLMEPVHGWLYRIFAAENEILVEFLLRLIPLIHVLMFLPLYWAGRALGGKPWMALLAVFVYASCSLGFARFSGSLLLKENFALPFLLLFLAAHFQYLSGRRPAWLLLAGAALLVLLASWHLSQFLVLVVLGSQALFLTGEKPRHGERSWLLPAAYLVACTCAGLTPSLWARGFLLSMTMAVPVAWLIVVLTRIRFPGTPLASRPLVFLLGLLVVLGGLSFLNRHYSGDYNHLFGLLVQKFAHLFQRPADPGQLPFDVRVFWSSPFNTPTWSEVWGKLGLHVITVAGVVAGTVRVVIKGRLEAGEKALVLTSGAFLTGWFLIERLGVVFWPVAVLVLVILLNRVDSTTVFRPRFRAFLGMAVLMLGLANLPVHLHTRIAVAADVVRGRTVPVGSSDQAYAQFRADLLQWILHNTPGPQNRFGDTQPLAVVGEIGMMPQVLLYTGRPVVLNSQFENAPIRRRYQRFLEALFSREPGQLQDFLQETQAGYLVINRHWALADSPGSAAYLAGEQGPLDLEMTICRLHFRPAEIPYLQPVYNNEFYRVFKVVSEPLDVPVTWERNHGNWWNLDRFTVAKGRLTNLTGDRQRLHDYEKQLIALQEAQARLLVPAGTGPSLPALHQQYIQLKLEALSARPGSGESTRIEAAQQRLVSAIQSRLARPHPAAGQPLGRALAGLYTRGIKGETPGWQELLSRGLAEPGHLAAAAQLLALVGQYGQAADLMLKAAGRLRLTPTVSGDGQPMMSAANLALQIRQGTLGYLLASARTAEAVERARAWLPYTPEGSSQETFLRQVAAYRP